MSTSPLAPVADADLDDLRRRLGATRLPPPADGSGWSRGTDLGILAELVEAWRSYDWRPHEERILAMPWERVGSAGRALNLVHQRATAADAPVVVLLHGWPDSVLRFERLLPLLTDLHVVVPALPGFPFAVPTPGTSPSVTEIATLVADALAALGHHRYVVSAGDVGADVAEHLADRHPQRVSALHLTNISPLHAVFADRTAMSAKETAYLDRVTRWQRAEGGYIAEQSTKPHTLAVGLTDSPAGLAAWIVEKLHGWSDHHGDLGSVFARDELLTWITTYWLSGCIGTSFSTYVELVHPVTYVATPTVVSTFAHDTKPVPRDFASRFVNVQRWIEHVDGGHFAAWEQPTAYAADLRVALALGQASALAR